MANQDNIINYHKFVEYELAKKGFRMVPVDEKFIKTRLEEAMKFVNEILMEYSADYGWKPLEEQYFLSPMVDKWKYSFAVLNEKNEICFLSFSSVYGSTLHLHCCYARKDTRGFNFSKHCMIKLCQNGIDNGFASIDAYWPKHNNGSIILFLKMGWKIENIVNDKKLFMKAELADVQKNAYELILSGQKTKQ
jgi:hypothetical protein